MIIDSHGHYTTAPGQLDAFRTAQLARLADPSAPPAVLAAISDDELRASVEANQLRIMRERGGELMLFAPKASAMGHHVPDPDVARAWAEASNDVVARVTALYPESFAGVAQLPQTPPDGAPGPGWLDATIAELRRSVTELGFVGVLVNPDPSGSRWTAPAVTDEAWSPLWEACVELDVPAVVHVSGTCTTAVHPLGAHYLNADTTVFMQLVENDLFTRFPTLRLVIPHGGGAVPYHWGRFRGLAARLGRPDPAELLRNVFFDTCVYHQPGIDLLLRVVPAENVLFASEMLGAVRGADPDSGVDWDDTKVYLERVDMSDEQRDAVMGGNARRVYPRLDARLREQGR
jgi:4-oxalmesaconate hydratase